MKTLPRRAVHGLVSLGLMVIALPAVAQSSENELARPPAEIPEAVRPFWAPLGLPRLRQEALPDEAPPIKREAFEVDPLVASKERSGVVRKNGEAGAVRLEIEPKVAWTRPLNRSADKPHFVSVSLLGSDGTVVTAGGAWLGITESPISGCGQLVVGTPSESGIDWQPLGMHARWNTYAGRIFASFSLITIRLDPANGTWDLYAGAQLARDNLPLAETKPTRSDLLSVTAGEDGAWISGLVQASEHPLVEDANANGVDDAFEREEFDGLLPTSASLEERKELAKAWRASERHRTAPALFVNRPRSDGIGQPTFSGSK